MHRRTTVEELEEVTLNDSRPDRTTRIGTLASLPVCQALTTFLRENQDVFTWSHEDMSGIDPSIIIHRLNVVRISALKSYCMMLCMLLCMTLCMT